MQNQTKNKFRFCSKTAFLTFPQSNLSKDSLQLLYEQWGMVSKYIIAQEEHKGEGKHFHVFLDFIDTIDTRNCDYFNVNGEHPNIQKPRRVDFVTKYVTKDGNYITNYSAEELREQQTKKKKKYNLDILSKKPLQALYDGDISWLQLEKFIKCKQLISQLEKPEKISPFNIDDNPWPTLNWGDFAFDREDMLAKKRHVWLWSNGPNTLKTTWALYVCKNYYADFYSIGELFQSFNENLELIFIDEYNSAKLTFSQLNQMCDGTYKYPIKGQTACTLNRPTIVILSNKPPAALYKNEQALTLLLSRFEVHELKQDMIDYSWNNNN